MGLFSKANYEKALLDYRFNVTDNLPCIEAYGEVFGAHLFPYSWVYDSKAYFIFAIVDTVGVLLICNAFGNAATAAFMVVMQIVLSLLLLSETKKDNRDN